MADDVAVADPEVDADNEVAEQDISLAGTVALALWLPTPARRRLIDADVDIVDDVEDGATVALVSTRGPAARRGSIKPLVERLPVVVVCHPGGEQAAVELMSLGACVVVAEGSEAGALANLDQGGATHLVDAYLRTEVADSGGSAQATFDAVTGLGSERRLELRFSEMVESGVEPWIGILDLGLAESLGAIGAGGSTLLRRRLALAAAAAAGSRGVETFDLGGRLLLMAGDMSEEMARSLARQIVQLGGSFRPAGRPLAPAMGWAGPNIGDDLGTIRVLAERALMIALGSEERMSSAFDSSADAAAAIELAAACGVADSVDGFDPRGEHSRTIAGLAVKIAAAVGLEAREVAEVGLAARLHSVGKVTFGADAFESDAERYGEAQTSHAERGARFVRTGAGPEVASAILSQYEVWDGSGKPDGVSGEEIPLSARIIAVAHAYDELSRENQDAASIRAALGERAGSSLDPDIVKAALTVLQ
ncbi:MAG: HD domain-containing protein [Acidimicrobiia bacterium]|nr:HD domain-containing protein [Acidimicrobiia bacterium]